MMTKRKNIHPHTQTQRQKQPKTKNQTFPKIQVWCKILGATPTQKNKMKFRDLL